MVFMIVVITPVIIIVILVIPVAFVHFPAFLIVVVMRMVPIGTGVWGALPASGNPAIVMPLWYPISLDPNTPRLRWGTMALIAERGRGCSNVNRNLTECRDCQSCS